MNQTPDHQGRGFRVRGRFQLQFGGLSPELKIENVKLKIVVFPLEMI